MKKLLKRVLVPILVLLILGAVYLFKAGSGPEYSSSVMDIPDFSGEPFVVINNNEPEFEAEDLTTDVYEFYSELDHLGRCGYTMACVGKELMPTQDRESISHIKPTGWVQAQYGFVDGESLYNRCHLIGFQLTGENANENNLITGTRFLNVEGMLPFENMVADYVKETGNHVLYRVTPIFDGSNLVARGVQMEAVSVEDDGEGICFNIYAYNNQPGVTIDYATGASVLADEPKTTAETTVAGEIAYILNTKSKKFHTADCEQAKSISENNAKQFAGSREELLADGYVAAKCCDP